MREVGHWCCVITMLYHTVIILHYSLLPILSTEFFKTHTFMQVFVVCVRDKVWDHSDQHLFTNHIRMSRMWLYPYFRPSVWTGLWIQDHLSLFCLFIKLKQKHCPNQQWNYKWFAHTDIHTHRQIFYKSRRWSDNATDKIYKEGWITAGLHFCRGCRVRGKIEVWYSAVIRIRRTSFLPPPLHWFLIYIAMKRRFERYWRGGSCPPCHKEPLLFASSSDNGPRFADGVLRFLLQTNKRPF